MWVWLTTCVMNTKEFLQLILQCRHWFPYLCTLFDITFEGSKWTRETEMKPQTRITKNAELRNHIARNTFTHKNTSAWRCTYQFRNFIPCWRTDDCALSGVNTSLLQVSEHQWGDPGGYSPPCNHFWWERLNTESTNATKDWSLTSHRAVRRGSCLTARHPLVFTAVISIFADKPGRLCWRGTKMAAVLCVGKHSA
jgi:hypothetical protein